MSSITFVTWNVRGFSSQTKKVKVFNHLNKLQADICLLQETHLSESDYNKIKSSNYSHLFSAHYNTKQRGVCILISKKISFVHNTVTDTPGSTISQSQRTLSPEYWSPAPAPHEQPFCIVTEDRTITARHQFESPGSFSRARERFEPSTHSSSTSTVTSSHFRKHRHHSFSHRSRQSHGQTSALLRIGGGLQRFPPVMCAGPGDATAPLL